MRYNERGEELLDDTPVEAPLAFKRPPSIQELIAMYVRNQFALERQMGVSDRSEAEVEEDFEIDEDGEEDIMTPYELHALASDAEEEYKRSTRHLRREKEPESGDAEAGKVGAGSGGDREAAGSGKKPEAGSADAKNDRAAGSAKSGVADEG